MATYNYCVLVLFENKYKGNQFLEEIDFTLTSIQYWVYPNF